MSNPSSQEVVKALQLVRTKIQESLKKCNSTRQVRLVAISKTKPVEMLKSCYDAGQIHFGENYVQELCEKAPKLPSDIRWHFVGHLQSNKVKQVVSVPGLFMVETVDSEKLANALNKEMKKREDKSILNVLVQVKTSDEETKSGIDPQHVLSLVQHIQKNCDRLHFSGLMTVGYAEDQTPNFKELAKLRHKIAHELNMDENEMELSMGMSADYESAIEYGSTSVRVGSTIFGARNYANKTNISENDSAKATISTQNITSTKHDLEKQ